jgi:hypothetical protein
MWFAHFRSRLLPVIAVLALVPTGVVAAADPSARSRPPAHGYSEPDAAAVALTEAAMSGGALGLVYDLDKDKYTVVIPSDGAAFSLGDVSQLGLDVVVKRSSVHRRDFDDARRRLRAFAHATHTDDPIGIYFDARTEQLVIETTLPVELIAETIRVYPNLVAYRHAESGGRDSRHADFAPFYGGAEVEEKPFANNFCSTGFAVREEGGSTEYMVTAGHCFELGTDVYSPGNSKYIGTVTIQAPWPEKDFEFISGRDYAGRIYLTPGVLSKSVVGAGNTAVGTQYCRSGARTFVVCQLLVNSVDADLCSFGQCTQHLARYEPLTGVWAEDGDSGAHFYLNVNSNAVSMRGIHIGHVGENHYATRWPTIRDSYGGFEIVSD